MFRPIKNIKSILIEFFNSDRKQLEQLTELEWAHIYKETIRGRKWLEELGISPGRWAGNYSFLYILTRVLIDYKPSRILEFGLGESSKLISACISNELQSSNHVVLEQSAEWIETFKTRYKLANNTSILHLPLIEISVNNYLVNSFKGIEVVKDSFELYIVDGPFGSDRYSRYDICLLAANFSEGDEFIIIIDDYNRIGEKDTANALLEIFQKKGINVVTGVYSGNKSQIIIATERYKYSTTF
jgi:hypothetical protein